MKPRKTIQSTLRDDTVDNSIFNFNFRYTEPLGGNHYFKVGSTFKTRNTKEDVNQQRIRNNEEQPFIYKYKHIENSYQTGISYNYTSKEISFSSKIEFQDINRFFGVINDSTVTRGKSYINPSFLLRYKPKKGRNFKLSYKKTITNPTYKQSSTVFNDLNPFSIRRGNPNLRAQKNDILLLITNINNFKSAFNFNSKLEYIYTKDAITPNITIDDDFINTRSYDNIGDKKKLNTTLSISKKISSLGLRYILKNRNTFSASNSLVNREINEVKTNNYSGSIAIENAKKGTIDIKSGIKYDLNTTKFSILENLNRNFTKQQYYTSFDYDVSKKINLNTQFDYIIFTDSNFKSNQKLPLWNAAISYAFSKNKNNILKLVFIDLLNKNVDITRRSTINYFEETTTESLGRYIILSYTYRLNNKKKKNRL